MSWWSALPFFLILVSQVSQVRSTDLPDSVGFEVVTRATLDLPQKVSARNQHTSDAPEKRVSRFLEQGRLREAETVVLGYRKKAKLQHERLGELFAMVAEGYEACGQPLKAIEVYRECIAIAPNVLKHRIPLAVLYYQQHMEREAAEQFSFIPRSNAALIKLCRRRTEYFQVLLEYCVFEEAAQAATQLIREYRGAGQEEDRRGIYMLRLAAVAACDIGYPSLREGLDSGCLFEDAAVSEAASNYLQNRPNPSTAAEAYVVLPILTEQYDSLPYGEQQDTNEYMLRLFKFWFGHEDNPDDDALIELGPSLVRTIGGITEVKELLAFIPLVEQALQRCQAEETEEGAMVLAQMAMTLFGFEVDLHRGLEFGDRALATSCFSGRPALMAQMIYHERNLPDHRDRIKKANTSLGKLEGVGELFTLMSRVIRSYILLGEQSIVLGFVGQFISQYLWTEEEKFHIWVEAFIYLDGAENWQPNYVMIALNHALECTEKCQFFLPDLYAAGMKLSMHFKDLKQAALYQRAHLALMSKGESEWPSTAVAYAERLVELRVFEEAEALIEEIALDGDQDISDQLKGALAVALTSGGLKYRRLEELPNAEGTKKKRRKKKKRQEDPPVPAVEADDQEGKENVKEAASRKGKKRSAFGVKGNALSVRKAVIAAKAKAQEKTEKAKQEKIKKEAEEAKVAAARKREKNQAAKSHVSVVDQAPSAGSKKGKMRAAKTTVQKWAKPDLAGKARKAAEERFKALLRRAEADRLLGMFQTSGTLEDVPGDGVFSRGTSQSLLRTYSQQHMRGKEEERTYTVTHGSGDLEVAIAALRDMASTEKNAPTFRAIWEVLERDPYSREHRGKKLTGELRGYRSFRLTKKDRVVISIDEGVVTIWSVKGHYDRLTLPKRKG